MLMVGIRQFFTRQNFPNPDSSKFSTVKILRHTVMKKSAAVWNRTRDLLYYAPHVYSPSKIKLVPSCGLSNIPQTDYYLTPM